MNEVGYSWHPPADKRIMICLVSPGSLDRFVSIKAPIDGPPPTVEFHKVVYANTGKLTDGWGAMRYRIYKRAS